MSEAEERARVIADGWAYVGTPFRHQCDAKGAGVDCAMWIVRAFVDCGVVEPFDPRPYPRLWFLHKSEELYLGWLNRFAEEIPAEEAKPGDIVIYKYGQCFSHAGMIVSDQLLIHAWFLEEQVRSCERFDIHLTHYGRDGGPKLCGKPRPVKYFDPWKKKRALGAAS